MGVMNSIQPIEGVKKHKEQIAALLVLFEKTLSDAKIEATKLISENEGSNK